MDHVMNREESLGMDDKDGKNNKNNKNKRFYVLYDGRAVPGVEGSTDDASVLDCMGLQSSDGNATSMARKDWAGYDWHLYSYASVVNDGDQLVDERYVSSCVEYERAIKRQTFGVKKK